MFFPGDPLNYPANSLSSIRRYESNRDPNNFDVKNFSLGDEWLNTTTNDWFKLASKANGSAVWCNLCASISGDPIDFILTDDGPIAVGPDAEGILTLSGGNGITTSGQDPSTEVVIDLDSPVSVPNGGTGLTIITDHSVVVGSGVAPLTELTVGLDGEILLGATAADPIFSAPTSSDNLLNFNLGPGTLDIVAQNAVASALALTEGAVVRGDGGGQDVQTSTVLISDAGEMTNPSQPAFVAGFLGAQNNVTGDGTIYTVIFGTVSLDQGGDFDGVSTFTAPVAGNYVFYTAVQLNGLGASTTGVQINIRARLNRAFQTSNGANNRSGGSNTLIHNGAYFIDMAASDTCFITVTASGGGLTLDIVNSTSNIFSGYLAPV
ncbi:MAG TPA: hypothetical protein ENI23_15100 [bacterium]|nr:hypothetical protein [bacterium]